MQLRGRALALHAQVHPGTSKSKSNKAAKCEVQQGGLAQVQGDVGIQKTKEITERKLPKKQKPLRVMASAIRLTRHRLIQQNLYSKTLEIHFLGIFL